MFPSNFLIEARIGCHYDASSKKRVLQEIAQLLASSTPGLDPAEVFEKLLERERLGSTGLGNGIGLPHARMAGVTQAYGALLQLNQGVDYDAIDDQPVDLVFGLLVPEEATDEHLQLLASLATRFSQQAVCSRLRDAEDSKQLLQQLLHSDGLAQSA